MYRVYCDDMLIHDQQSPDLDIHLVSPQLKLQVNAAGSFEFSMPTTNPGYGQLERFVSTIAVEKDGDIIWTGRIMNESEDFWRQRKYTCEGALAFLNDTTQPSAGYTNVTNTSLLNTFITNHNTKKAITNETDRQFALGNIDVTIDTLDLSDDAEPSTANNETGEVPYQFKTDGENTWEAIKTIFLDRIGGYIYITYNSNSNTPYKPVFNYVMTLQRISEQELRFGENLLDYSKTWDMSNIATVIIPKGTMKVTTSSSN